MVPSGKTPINFHVLQYRQSAGRAAPSQPEAGLWEVGPRTMQSTRAKKDDPPCAPLLKRAALRRLNLFFIFNIAASPLPTSRVINDVDLGYGTSEPRSERKKFERDRRELARRGIHIVEVQRKGAAANEESWWALDRARSASPLSSHSTDELDYLLTETEKLATNPFWRGERSLSELQRSLRIELAGRYGDALPQPVSSIDAPEEDALVHLLWEAFDARRPVRFSYLNREGALHAHTVDIYAFFQLTGLLYFVGLDCGAEPELVKTFRCDRIQEIEAVEGNYLVPPSFDLADYLFLPFDFSPRAPVEAVFSFPASISPLEISSISHGRGTLSPGKEPSTNELHIEVRDLDAAAAWALSHTSMGMRPLSPEPLVDAWRAGIQKALAAHEPSMGEVETGDPEVRDGEGRSS